MRRVTKRGFEGVYERVESGKVANYTAYIPDPSKKSGKRSVGTFRTAREARQARIDELAHLAKEPEPLPAGVRRPMTANEFANCWYDAFPHRRASSESTSKYTIKEFLSRWGELPMHELPYDDIRDWGRTTSLNKMKVARNFIYEAKEYGAITGDNPLARLGRKESRGRRDIDIITEDELWELADLALAVFGPDFGPYFRAHIIFSAFTCMRPAEVCPLLRSNIKSAPEADGRYGIIKVVDNLGRTGEVTTPKNHRTRDIIMPLPAKRVVDALPPYLGSPYQFTSKTGRRLSKSSQHAYWDGVRKAMAAKTGDHRRWAGFDLYELRHYGASFLYNVLRVRADAIAFQLGHTGSDGPKLVMELYGHPSHDMFRREIAEAYASYDADARSLGRTARPNFRLATLSKR